MEQLFTYSAMHKMGKMLFLRAYTQRSRFCFEQHITISLFYLLVHTLRFGCCWCWCLCCFNIALFRAIVVAIQDATIQRHRPEPFYLANCPNLRLLQHVQIE